MAERKFLRTLAVLEKKYATICREAKVEINDLEDFEDIFDYYYEEMSGDIQDFLKNIKIVNKDVEYFLSIQKHNNEIKRYIEGVKIEIVKFSSYISRSYNSYAESIKESIDNLHKIYLCVSSCNSSSGQFKAALHDLNLNPGDENLRNALKLGDEYMKHVYDLYWHVRRRETGLDKIISKYLSGVLREDRVGYWVDPFESYSRARYGWWLGQIAEVKAAQSRQGRLVQDEEVISRFSQQALRSAFVLDAMEVKSQKALVDIKHTLGGRA
ncbi:MAG TPA: hypothetical protein HPQ04_05610 [Rhodospirillaceae bacterium]|nr:hypothetical protein [Rhodospirillaceae bacterium]